MNNDVTTKKEELHSKCAVDFGQIKKFERQFYFKLKCSKVGSIVFGDAVYRFTCIVRVIIQGYTLINYCRWF